MNTNDASQNKMVQPETENKTAEGQVSVEMLKGALKGRTLQLSSSEAARFVRIGNAKYVDPTQSGKRA